MIARLYFFVLGDETQKLFTDEDVACDDLKQDETDETEFL